MKSPNRSLLWLLLLALLAVVSACDLGSGASTVVADGNERQGLGHDRPIPDDSGCVPACVNKQCGPNGCNGSCGTCAGGTTCSGGRCVGSGGCVEGETACDPARPMAVLVCRSNSWQAQACPNHQLCSNKKCREVCDGWLDATVPTVCFVPHWESHQVYLYSNDASRLGQDHTQFGISNGGNPVEMDWDTTQPWPDLWKLNCQTGISWIYYRLNQLSLYCLPTVNLVMKLRKGAASGKTSRWEVDFLNASQQMAVSQGEVPATFQTYVVGLSSPLNAGLDLTGQYNQVQLRMTGSGTTASCEPVYLNYLVLQVKP